MKLNPKPLHFMRKRKFDRIIEKRKILGPILKGYEIAFEFQNFKT